MNPAQVQPVFARHETFQPRFGWFKKAFDAGASSEGRIFNADDATVQLGVGKNMVRSIKFWGVASKVLLAVQDPENKRGSLAVPSVFGRSLFGEDGWDPYLEDPGSIWLLHWALLRPRCVLPVWWVAFNEFDALEFHDVDLNDAVMRRAALVAEWSQPHGPSVKKDVDCLLRMYCPGDLSKSVEDAIDCPFRQLKLVEPVKDLARTYRFMLGHKPTLPPEVIVFGVLDYMAQAVSASTITIAALASAPAGPGRVFRISDDEIAAALHTVVAERSKAMRIESPAGARQLMLFEPPGRLATTVLNRYYKKRHESVRSVAVSSASLFQDSASLELVGA